MTSSPSPLVNLVPRTDDWAWIQVQYETTGRSIQDIARQAKVQPTAIISRASQLGWTRRAETTVVQKAAEIIAQSQEKARQELQAKTEIIERVNVEMQAKVLLEHRKDIQRARKLCMNLLGELEAIYDNLPELQSVGEALRSENEKGVDKMNDAYRAIISLPERSKSLKALGESMKTLIALERQAFGIKGVLEDAEDTQSDPADVVAGMDLVLSKFATILQRTGDQIRPKPMGDVLDISPTKE